MQLGIHMKLIKLLKKIPIDFAQAELKHKTKGKLIAYDEISTVSKGTALDIGCRDGYWTKQLEKKGYKVTSVDIDPKYPGAATLDVNDGLPYKANSFDAIWCSEVIEHLYNPEASIKDMLRCLKPGGTIALTTPNSYMWVWRPLYLLGIGPAQIQNDDHKYFFDRFSLNRVIPKGSKVYGFFPYMFIKCKITTLSNLLSPTFTIIIKKPRSEK
jgi:2-polyprenyl-3-methyl-5-hydroxy-6-metoxy-1,4-benzoquinol methylase